MHSRSVCLLNVVIFLCVSKIFGQNFDNCLPNERQCRNGQCVEAVKFCDRYTDCDDGSDEADCNNPQQGML